jgi:hypothetical protein
MNMSGETTSNPTDRLIALEAKVKALEETLAVEKRKTAEMQQLLRSYKYGVDQVLIGYEKAFEQAAKSYEPIIQRALTLSRGPLIAAEPPKKVEAVEAKKEAENAKETVNTAIQIVTQEGGSQRAP